eukprot:scaffold56389_cov75-Cyclotella_meneghiniana.AAC.3
MVTRALKAIASLAFMASSTSFAWQGPFPQVAVTSRPVIDNASTDTPESSPLRRAFLLALTPSLLSVPQIANAATVSSSSNLSFTQTPTGLQYADIKVGSGSPAIQRGSTVSIEYVLSTTGAKFGNKIYSSADAGAPYQWKFGDGSTIPGLEEAVSTMSTGGIRRVIIPSKLAYQANSNSSPTTEECQNGSGLGPRPSVSEKAFHPLMFQRFNNIYCSTDSQPDLAMDVELLN